MNTEKIKNSFFKIEAVVSNSESWLLSLWLLSMLVFGTIQVLLRNFFDSGMDWSDMMVRSLVLWVGFTGASLATRRDRHINIEIISRLITAKGFSKFRIVYVRLVSLIISVLLLKASITYIFLEAENEMTAFLGVPTWIIFIIVPVSLFLMSARILISLFINRPLETETL